MGKIRVEELAAQMGIGSKEVLFLLQSIGVDVKSPQAALDESTVLAILQGKTHAPKQLIVRDNEARAARPQKSALNRIKIVEKPAAGEGRPGRSRDARGTRRPSPRRPRLRRRPSPPPPGGPGRRGGEGRGEGRGARPDGGRHRGRAAGRAGAGEARPAAPSPQDRSAPAPRRPAAPPPRRPLRPPRPGAPISRPMGRPPAAWAARWARVRRRRPPDGPAPAASAVRWGRGPTGPSVYRPTPGGPGARPLGGPPRPGAPVGRTAPRPASASRPAKRKKADEDAKKTAAGKRSARPKITVADEVDLREFVGTYKEDTYSDISLPLIEKTGDGDEASSGSAPVSKSAIRRAAKETRAHDSGKLLEFKKPAPTGPVFFTEGVTVKELSEKLGVLARDIQRLLMQRGILATVNQTLDAATAVQIAKEVGVEAAVVSFEEELELTRSAKETSEPSTGARACRERRS